MNISANHSSLLIYIFIIYNWSLFNSTNFKKRRTNEEFIIVHSSYFQFYLSRRLCYNRKIDDGSE